MTAQQYIENMSVSSRTLWSGVVFFIGVTVSVMLWANGAKNEVVEQIAQIRVTNATTLSELGRLSGEVEAIRFNQQAGIARADLRQDELRNRIDAAVATLDNRIRPLEQSSAANAAEFESQLAEVRKNLDQADKQIDSVQRKLEDLERRLSASGTR